MSLDTLEPPTAVADEVVLLWPGAPPEPTACGPGPEQTFRQGVPDGRTTTMLRNVVTPSLTVVGVQFTFLLGGTVIVERLFSYEGLGNLAIDAVVNRDLPLIQGIVLLFAVIFVGVNLAVDLCYVALNPKLRHG